MSRWVVCSLTLVLIAWVQLSHAATVNLSWSPVTVDVDNATLSTPPRYRAYYGTAPQTYTTTADVGLSTTASLSGLAGDTTYFFAVTAYNAAGESGYSHEVASTTPTENTEAPTVVLTSPAAGSTVPRKGQVTLAATASDDGTVVRVEFYVNGQLTCTDTTPAYTCRWRVPSPPRRTYTLAAQAFDVSNNQAMSPPVTVTSN